MYITILIFGNRLTSYAKLGIVKDL